MTHFPALLQKVSARGGALPRRSQRGFTLVELMVAVTLGLLLMVALIAVFLNVNRTNTEMAKTNSLIENGRFAIDILQEDIEHAGFWGGYVPQFDDLSSTAVPSDAPAMTPDPCLAYANWDITPNLGYRYALIGIPVQSFDTSPTNCAFVTNQQPNTDVLVTRHAETCLPGVGSCEALDNNKVYFQSSFCEAETTAANRYVLSNTSASFILTNRNCTTVADKRKFISNVYYVRNYAVTAGDGIPTLMRASFNATAADTPPFDPPVALIEGIQGFRVELGIDAKSRCNTDVDYSTATVIPPTPASSTAVQRVDPLTCALDVGNYAKNTLPPNRGDGVPEAYVRCSGSGGCDVTQLRNVVSAKLYVLARSSEKALGQTDSKTYALGSTTLGPFNDGYKRHVFETTVRLTNISGRRETP